MKVFAALMLIFLQSCATTKVQFKDGIFHAKSNQKLGFYSDYFYKISKLATREKKIYIAIIPNNTPGTIIADDEGDYCDLWNGYAKKWSLGSNLTHDILEKLPVVVMAPAFPTQNSGGVYSSLLNEKSMKYYKKEWNRIDLQLTAQIDDLIKTLEKDGWRVHKKVLFYGFSSQSDFSNRFALLHPERVKAVAVGGIVDYITLPILEYRGKILNYPLGIANLEKDFGVKFNKSELEKVKFFWFDGDDDKNTTFNKGHGVWKNEDIDLIFELFSLRKYDEKNLYDPKILQTNLEIIKQNKINFEYKRYNGVKHNITAEMRRDVVDFFTRAMEFVK